MLSELTPSPFTVESMEAASVEEEEEVVVVGEGEAERACDAKTAAAETSSAVGSVARETARQNEAEKQGQMKRVWVPTGMK